MIDRVDNELLEWLTAQVGVEAVLGPPLGMAAKPAIRVYLLEMTNDPAPRGLNRAPFQVVLKYLITVSDDEHIGCWGKFSTRRRSRRMTRIGRFLSSPFPRTFGLVFA